MKKKRLVNGAVKVTASALAMALMITSVPLPGLTGTDTVYAAEKAAETDEFFIAPDGERPNNVAGSADVSTSYVSGWETLTAVNDGKVSKTSGTGKEETGACYGSWGNPAKPASETLTYTWENEVELNSSGVYFWYDGDEPDSGGIKIPKSCKYEYMDADGNFVEVGNAKGLGCRADGFNITTFDTVKTKGLRVTIEKQKADENGVGVIEWEAYGKVMPFNIAPRAEASASINRPEDLGGIDALNDEAEPAASAGAGDGLVWHSWTNEGQMAYVQYTWQKEAVIDSTEIYYFTDNGGILAPEKTVVEYWDAAAGDWAEAAVVTENKLDAYNVVTFDQPIKTNQLKLTMTPQGYGTPENHAVGIKEWKVLGNAEKPSGEVELSNDYFYLKIGKYGHIDELKIQGDLYDTNYVLNAEYAPTQGASKEHQWMGELMFQTKWEGEDTWTESMTSASDNGSKTRKIELKGNKVEVTYEDAKEDKGIKDFKLVETYELVDNQIVWSMTVTNTKDKNLIIGDFGVPMPFSEFWPGGTQVYETSVVDHSFVGQDSSYIYASRPSGQGKFLLFTPDTSTGAGFEYQDHWRINNGHAGSVWAQDQGGWANGLNVFYIHSDVIKSTGSSYLENTSLTLAPGESKTYTFKFTGVDDEQDMKTKLYEEGIIDAVAVPSMAFSVNMPAKFYLHTSYGKDQIQDIQVNCSHDTGLYEGLQKSVSNKQECTKEEGTKVEYLETVTQDGEQYHIYNLQLSCLGANHVEITYDDGKQTTLQFYAMDSVEDALELHADFVTEKTQVNAPGEIYDKIFDDWMMDTKSVRGVYEGYFGWGDDWGFTHGEYLAEKNVYQPVKEQITAVDEYLDTFIWNGLMKEHQEDYMVNDWLDNEPNNTGQGIYRGYAYPHVYNTYFSMYKIAEKYPDMIDYAEDKGTYLLRAANILKALYSKGVSYNWDTGLMGESTTPDIIAALESEGYYDEAAQVTEIMDEKYSNFKGNKYPYGSEYAYDNTGEEAVYTLAKLNDNTDMMGKIDLKTRACRGLQPIWYHYGNPTTICGENWWNFQYTASLAGYCMDDWLRLQDNGLTETEMADAARVNYAGKLANLTCINSGQIDADPENIGTVSWTYQSELGNSGGQGTGGGSIHNGWRQMSGEADTGLFGALRILSSDVSTDNIFGLFGYGCEVSEEGGFYQVTPLDGVYTRLNFINQKLSIELDRDQYTRAKVSKDSNYVELNVRNLEVSEHKSDIEFTGLKPGSYQIKVNGNVTGSFQYIGEETTVVSVPLPAAETASVVIEEGEPLENTAPAVDAGKDLNVYLSDTYRLEGAAKDDGYPNMTLTSLWEVTSKPEGANVTIANPDKLISGISVDKAGTYQLKLSVSDGALSAEDTLTLVVKEDEKLPEVLANYEFEEVDVLKRVVKDSSSAGNDAAAVSKPAVAEGKEGNAVNFTGTYCGYVKMPSSLTKNVTDCTILADVKLNAVQGSGARIFHFGDTDGKRMYVSFEGKNELVLGITDTKTNKTAEYKTGIKLGTGFWKNIALTMENQTLILYVDGEAVYTLEDCGFTLADLGDVQMNYIGRSENKQSAFLNGLVDNFTVKSAAMTAEELADAYAPEEDAKPVSAEVGSYVTVVGKAPELPETLRVLYDNGIYKDSKVIWEAVSEDKYGKAGSFKVNGTVEGMDHPVQASVFVMDGEETNLASLAKPTAIINSVNDLGGVAGLNDGFEPSSSMDTSHGVWHNWLGNQGGEAWVQYTWEKEIMITASDAYYFKDGGGNFCPVSVKYEYLGSGGDWQAFTGTDGLGVATNKYNKTTFDPVMTKAIRMTMTPEKLGCGVIEWKVYGYQVDTEPAVDMTELKKAVELAETKAAYYYTAETWSTFADVLEEAENMLSDETAVQDDVDALLTKLQEAKDALEIMPGAVSANLAPQAEVSASVNKVQAVKDGIDPVNSSDSSNGVWDSTGEEGREAWVQYDFEELVRIDSTDIYYYQDGGKVKLPKEALVEYLNDEGVWTEAEKITEMKENQYNTITLKKPVLAAAIRVTLQPQDENSAIGIIEWKVSGELVSSQGVNKKNLRNILDIANTKAKGRYTAESWAVFAEALANAQNLVNQGGLTQEEINATFDALYNAVNELQAAEQTQEIMNIAPEAAVSANINSPNDLGGADTMKDGYDPASSMDKSNGTWHNWGQEGKEAWVQYDWDTAQEIHSIDVYYFTDGGGILLPAESRFEYLGEDGQWYEMNTVSENIPDAYNTLNLENPVMAKALKITMQPVVEAGGLHGVGIIEWRVMAMTGAADSVITSELEGLIAAAQKKSEADYTVLGWSQLQTALGQADNALGKGDVTQEEIDAAAKALQEAMIIREDPVVPADKKELINLITLAESKLSGKYTTESLDALKKALQNAKKTAADEKAVQEEVDQAKTALEAAIAGLKVKEDPKPIVNKAELQKLINSYAGLKSSDYTAVSWSAYLKVLNNAKMVNLNANAAQKDVDAALSMLQQAYKALVKAPVVKPVPKKNAVVTIGNAKYKVTKSSSKNGTVMYVKPTKITFKKVTIPAAVKINGYTFKVTQIAKKAFYKNKKLQSVTIGKYVTNIGPSAFRDCKKLKSVVIGSSVKRIEKYAFMNDKNLKKITIKSKNLKTIQKKAFTNIYSKAEFKVPAKKLKNYKKHLLDRGVKTTAKFKKL
ncbi:DUF5695 domain-containing protein [Robinsoniella peoriensis]|uniref:DUF5695 domain-containing protein n=1 Tax=Robinsoniella peoriensis TaxID=180332 RepID=UPI0006947100|nr:DUF5695 domain-containing protein [Robinsoniella peoriensis]